MAGVAIVTDSACDLPAAIVSELGIRIVPLSIRFGTDEYFDRDELSTTEFWRLCSEFDGLPETAAPSPGAFEKAYREAADDGATGVVSIHISSDLSATSQAAETAARAVDDIEISVVDSRTVSMGEGLIVVEAARSAASGVDAAAVANYTSDLAARTKVFGALDTLENLKRGGRIGAAQSLLGSLLNIKPIIEVRDGVVEAAGRQRTRGRALTHLVDLVAEAMPVERLAVMHADCDDVDDFVNRLAKTHSDDIIVGEIGPVVGTHAGRGTIGVIFQVPPA